MMAMNFKFRVPNLFKSVRYMLFVVNGVFLITGLILLIIGVTVFTRFTLFDELITTRFFNIAAFVIATGVIIILGTTLGLYGAFSRHFYFISAFVILLLVILVFEISITIVGFSLSDDPPSEIRSTMADSLKLYGTRIEIAQVWDQLQMAFECCGVTGRFDWTPADQIPVSCCYIEFGTISPFECGIGNSHATGCALALGEYLSNQAYIIAIAGLVVTCIQVPLIGLSAYVAWRSKYDEIELEK